MYREAEQTWQRFQARLRGIRIEFRSGLAFKELYIILRECCTCTQKLQYF